MTLLYHTGSVKLVVGVKDCVGCLGSLYDTSSSTNFKWLSDTTTTETYYDGTSYTGKLATDQICPTNSLTTCMKSF